MGGWIHGRSVVSDLSVLPISSIRACSTEQERKASSLQECVTAPTSPELVARILALSSDRFTPAMEATSLMSSSSLQTWSKCVKTRWLSKIHNQKSRYVLGSCDNNSTETKIWKTFLLSYTCIKTDLNSAFLLLESAASLFQLVLLSCVQGCRTNLFRNWQKHKMANMLLIRAAHTRTDRCC